jgi:hypothetical protein
VPNLLASSLMAVNSLATWPFDCIMETFKVVAASSASANALIGTPKAPAPTAAAAARTPVSETLPIKSCAFLCCRTRSLSRF